MPKVENKPVDIIFLDWSSITKNRPSEPIDSDKFHEKKSAMCKK